MNYAEEPEQDEQSAEETLGEITDSGADSADDPYSEPTEFDAGEVADAIEEMILFIVRTIARKPDAVALSRSTEDDGLILYRLNVDDDDKGRVIGREGRVAAAMRSLMRVAAIKAQIRVKLDIE